LYTPQATRLQNRNLSEILREAITLTNEMNLDDETQQQQEQTRK
jgi:hypothetical protein